MSISGVVARRRVEELEAAIPFYERLCGESARRFSFGSAQLAAVGPFLLFCAAGELGEQLERVVATVEVDDVVAQADTLRELGAEIIAPPATTPNGHRLIARHPDGGVFEYVGP